MTKFKKQLLVVAGLAALMAADAIMNTEHHPAQAAPGPPVTPVSVVSPSPLPVSLQGTGTIAGNVNAAQSGSWNVGVNNLPATQAVSGTVSVSNLPSSQGVSNTSATPLYVRDVDNPAHHPFATSLSCNIDPATSQSCASTFPVPSGMELVIETFSVSADLASGQKGFGFIQVTTGGGTVSMAVPLSFTGTFAIFDSYAVTQPLRLYADPSSTVQLGASQTGFVGGAELNFTVSGYTVACGPSAGCPIP